MKSILWYVALISITSAYLIALTGVRSAKQRDVTTHSRRMIIACSIVGIWLVAYISKQVLFGRESFGGTSDQYWFIYMPIFMVHMALAVTTIGLGVHNLCSGLTRLHNGTGGSAMVAVVSRHRLLGTILIWTFSGTMITAYLVYLMLFVWFPVS